MESDKRDYINNDDQNIIEAFNYFDTNNNGLVNIDEIKRVLTTFGEKMSEKEFHDIFKSVEVDNKGNIDYIQQFNL